MDQDLSESFDLYQKARLLMDKNHLEDAIVLFQRSAELSAHFKTTELLGECYIRLNRLREAVIPLMTAIDLNDGVRAASLLADVFLKLEDYEAAKETAEVALSRDPNNKKALEVIKVVADLNGDA